PPELGFRIRPSEKREDSASGTLQARPKARPSKQRARAALAVANRHRTARSSSPVAKAATTVPVGRAILAGARDNIPFSGGGAAMQRITPMLWFDSQAEDAAKVYTSLFKKSKITDVTRY